jgi:hypothetical protein
MMHLQGTRNRQTGLGTQAGHRKSLWQFTIWLLLLALVATPAFAAPLGQDPTPLGDPDTGFIEFGPTNGELTDQFVAQTEDMTFMATPAFMVARTVPAGDLPSYDDEALAQFNGANSVEIIRHMAVDIGPRLSGTPQEGEAAAYLGNILQSYGYEVTYSTFSQTSTRNVATVTSPNATLPGGPNWQMSSSTSGKVTGDADAVQAEVVYAGSGQSLSDFPADTADKIVLMDYSTSSTPRNTAVVNAVSLGAAGVILADTRSNRAPPSFSLTTPQPDIPVVGGGTAHGDWIRELIAAGPLTLRIATNRYVGVPGVNMIAVRHAVNDPDGTAPIVMVGSHFDSVLGGPGADDNASGTGIYMEVARVLSGYALDKEIRIGGYGNEEGGMRGSRAYVASLSPEESARFVGSWVMDMVGTPNPPARVWAHTLDGNSNYIIQSAYDAEARIGSVGLQNCKVSGSDHEPFANAGIPSAVFSWMAYQPRPAGCTVEGSLGLEPQYHRPTDTMDNISPERLQVMLNLVGSSVFHSALNAVTLFAAGGAPASGAAVEANCGDGQRYLGETGDDGNAAAVIPHATCDFKATKGLAISTLDDVAIASDASLAFPTFHLPEPVLLHDNSVDPVHGTIGEDWASCDALDTDSVGAKTINCTDGAGTVSEVMYNVIYDFSGFSRPVDNVPALNIANSGQAIPLKWLITDVNGVPVTKLANVVVTATDFPCDVGATASQIEEYTPGASGLLNKGKGNYQFNWQTPKSYAQSCKTMKLDLGEGPGMERTAVFEFPN